MLLEPQEVGDEKAVDHSRHQKKIFRPVEKNSRTTRKDDYETRKESYVALHNHSHGPHEHFHDLHERFHGLHKRSHALHQDFHAPYRDFHVLHSRFHGLHRSLFGLSERFPRLLGSFHASGSPVGRVGDLGGVIPMRSREGGRQPLGRVCAPELPQRHLFRLLAD